MVTNWLEVRIGVRIVLFSGDLDLTKDEKLKFSILKSWHYLIIYRYLCILKGLLFDEDVEEKTKIKIEKINNYYLKFREVYTKENCPKWFQFIEAYNTKFNDYGYSKYEHELGHNSILQTPLPTNPKVVIVGKNNSWFDYKNMERGLKIVKDLEKTIPVKDYLSERGSKYAEFLKKEINKVGERNWLYKNTLNHSRVAMNRIWLQTGPKSKYLKHVDKILLEKCHLWTEEIIRIIDPEIVFLFGALGDPDAACNLFNKKEEGESFIIKHCYHPSGSGKKRYERNVYNYCEGLAEVEKRNSRRKNNINQ